MPFTTFANLFPAVENVNGHFGRWDDTETESTHFYYTNAAGQVGAVRYNRRTTVSECRVVYGEDAELLIHYYRK